MKLQERFLDVTTPGAVREQPHVGPSPRSPNSMAHGTTAAQTSQEHLSPGHTSPSQGQNSDNSGDSSDWAISTERLRAAIGRADGLALALLQRSLEAQVVIKEAKLTQARARLYLITERQQQLRRNPPDCSESTKNAAVDRTG